MKGFFEMTPLIRKLSSAFLVLALLCANASAATTMTQWSPQFKGIDSASGNNTPSATMPNQHVVHALRVDLTDPDIQLRTTPRVPSNYQPNTRETIGLTVSDFLVNNQLQAAVNANFFSSQGYYPPAGTAFNVHGLQIDRGTNVSTVTSSSQAATLIFSPSNTVTLIPNNFPQKPLTNAYTAVTGEIALVLNGTNRMTRDFDVQPRTVFGVSADRRYLYLIAIDGRQPGYSDGATLYECGQWLLLYGASDGINMDGGGSTVLAIANSTGAPVRLNSSSAVAGDPAGRERVVGSHLGVYAKPLPGFINDVQATPDDTTAVISWTTLSPASSEVRYGQTTEFELGTMSEGIVTNVHTVTLTNLTPATTYFYQITASGQQQYTSLNFSFTTTNYVTTNTLFDINHEWKYFYEPLDGVTWMAANYDDSAWFGPAPGLFWADSRATPNPNIQYKATQLPTDQTTSFPYVTYYLRTTFVLTNNPPGSSLEISGYIDDGAIFYLNGARIYSLRLPDDAMSTTIATGFPCLGDADCLDTIVIPASALTNLVIGTNILAAEVHNYNARSPDLTFGVALARIEQMSRDITLQVSAPNGKVSLEWSDGAILQSSSNVDGPWEDVDPAPASPLVLEPTATSQFYRLRR
jgi:exopolysaccharide biosynthesis protein